MREVSWRVAVLGLLAATVGCAPSLIDLVEKQDSPGVKAALAAGANPNQADRRGNSVLAIAVSEGNFNVFLSLLDAGADPNSAVHSAALISNGDFMRELLRRGADANLPNPNRKWKGRMPTPLFGAGVEVARALLEGGADANRQNDDGFTPLYTAIVSGSEYGLKTAIVLLEGGADPRLGPTNILNDTSDFWSFVKDRNRRQRIMDQVANGPDKKTAEVWLKMRLLLIEKGYLDEDPEKVIPDADPMPEKKPADGEQAKDRRVP